MFRSVHDVGDRVLPHSSHVGVVDFERRVVDVSIFELSPAGSLSVRLLLLCCVVPLEPAVVLVQWSVPVLVVVAPFWGRVASVVLTGVVGCSKSRASHYGSS